MEGLNEFKEELYKCSRCALCQSVCPVYKATLNECAVSKGKFNMLNGVLQGDLAITKQMKKYLDTCTGCNACKDFCPSGIDARKILRCAKEEYYRLNPQPPLSKLLNSHVTLELLLKLSKPCFAVYRALKISFLVRLFEKILLNTGILGKRLLLLDFLADSYSLKPAKVTKNITKTAVYFEGCVNKHINPQTKNAVFLLLQNAGYKILQRNFNCCGITFLNDGNTEEFKKLITKNLSQLPENYDCILTDCGSCCDVLKQYKDYTSTPSAEEVSQKTISILELLKEIKFKTESNMRIAVHQPCHEEFDLKVFVKNIDGINYTAAQDDDKCCGFSGTFAVKNAAISRKISLKKAQNYINANADIVLTTCPSCMLGLEQGFIDTKLPYTARPKVMNLFVFLAKYCSVD